MSLHINRRRFERFALPPMYTPITVRPLGGGQPLEGHTHDISEGGVRFELDRIIDPGSPVSAEISLPGYFGRAPGTVLAYANVIWADDDEDEPGPVRMAAAFTRFARDGDKDRLLGALASGRYARAA